MTADSLFDDIWFQGKTNVPKPMKRRKWRKPLLQLVVDPPRATTPPTSSQEPSDSGEANNTKLKLPRSMTSKGSNMLRERNADQSGGESVGNGGFVQSSSGGASGSTTSDEKENHTRRI